MKTCRHASCGEVCKYPPKEKKKYSLRRMTNKRGAEYSLYKPAREAYLEAHPICEVEGCKHYANDVHHRKGRNGKLLYDMRWFMAVCRVHHHRMKENPKWAMENGYIISRLSKTLEDMRVLENWQQDFILQNHKQFTAEQIAVKIHCAVDRVREFCCERQMSLKGNKYNPYPQPRKKHIRMVPLEPDEEKNFERPKAEYGNIPSPYGIATAMKEGKDP